MAHVREEGGLGLVCGFSFDLGRQKVRRVLLPLGDVADVGVDVSDAVNILVILVVLGLLWWGVSSLMTSPEERAHKDCLESAYRTGLGLDDSLRRQIQDRCERTHLG